MRQLTNFAKFFLLFGLVLFVTSCTIYTEKRSQALSRAVAATADSIESARIDLAYRYSKEAEKIAYPPKTRIEIKPLITENVKSVVIENSKPRRPSNPTTPDVSTSIVKINTTDNQQQTILRLVVPEHLKNAKLLVENSAEWNELVQNKEFLNQLKKDHKILKEFSKEVEQELYKQKTMNDKMVQDLNQMQKKLGEKDAAIWIRNFIILVLTIILGGGIYLKMKGVL